MSTAVGVLVGRWLATLPHDLTFGGTDVLVDLEAYDDAVHRATIAEDVARCLAVHVTMSTRTVATARWELVHSGVARVRLGQNATAIAAAASGASSRVVAVVCQLFEVWDARGKPVLELKVHHPCSQAAWTEAFHVTADGMRFTQRVQQLHMFQCEDDGPRACAALRERLAAGALLQEGHARGTGAPRTV